MAKMTFQRLNLNKDDVGDPLEVQFNPPEYELTKNANFAEVVIPGLDSPIIQFVNGESEKLTLELFFDSTEEGGTGADAKSVHQREESGGLLPFIQSVKPSVDDFYKLVKVDGDTHAPPIVRITWGESFPGVTTDGSQQAMPAFDAVVESLSRKYTLFNSEGVPLRATVSITLREYKTIAEQLTELNLRSADHTRAHIVRQGETLPNIAYGAYQDANRWRVIADYNNLFNVRTLQPGTVLLLPPVS